MEITPEECCATSSISSAISWLIVSLSIHTSTFVSTSFAKRFHSQTLDYRSELQPNTPYPPIPGSAPVLGSCKTQSSFFPGNYSPPPQSSATGNATLRFNPHTHADSCPQFSREETAVPSYVSPRMYSPVRLFLGSLLHVLRPVTVRIYREWHPSTQTLIHSNHSTHKLLPLLLLLSIHNLIYQRGSNEWKKSSNKHTTHHQVKYTMAIPLRNSISSSDTAPSFLLPQFLFG